MEISALQQTIVIGSILLLFMAIIIVVSIVRYNSKNQIYALEKQNLQSQFTQTLLQTQLEIQEQTLQSISQEIHDNTGQLLGLIKLNIATTNVEQPEKAREKLADTLGLVGQVITGIRQLSHTLDTGFVARQGLRQAIAHQLELVQKTGALQTHLEVSGEETRFDNQKELILFRMVQETLNNIIKHAGATDIQIHIRYGPSACSITVRDNGNGFDGAVTGTGIGLQNMHNRAKMIGATLTITSQPAAGTTVTINLPLEAAQPGDNH